ncbi:MAG: hypothetical protein ACK539_08165 [Planctomycetota bacterium]
MSSARSIVPFACAALLATVAAATAQQITIADKLYPGAVEGDRGPLLKRLVDDLTGEPLAGAEVFLIAESKTPIGGEFWWTHRGAADPDGFVRIDRPKGNRDWHIAVVKHPRTGVAVSRLADAQVVRVGRGQDVPVQVVDWLGRPAGGRAGRPRTGPGPPGTRHRDRAPCAHPVHPAATARTHRSPAPSRRVPAARAHCCPAATAQRPQLRPTPSLRSVALVGSVPLRSRRRPAPRRIGPRRGRPERAEHPRARRRIVDRRQRAPRARALRADQHFAAKRAPQQVRPRQTLPATAATGTAVWQPQSRTVVCGWAVKMRRRVTK